MNLTLTAARIALSFAALLATSASAAPVTLDFTGTIWQFDRYDGRSPWEHDGKAFSGSIVVDFNAQPVNHWSNGEAWVVNSYANYGCAQYAPNGQCRHTTESTAPVPIILSAQFDIPLAGNFIFPAVSGAAVQQGISKTQRGKNGWRLPQHYLLEARSELRQGDDSWNQFVERAFSIEINNAWDPIFSDPLSLSELPDVSVALFRDLYLSHHAGYRTCDSWGYCTESWDDDSFSLIGNLTSLTLREGVPGDTGEVPEPGLPALLGASLVAAWVVRRRGSGHL